ncbi:MAG TPA: hypothetical protein VGR77_09590 [Candidatus Dormibacteraeota bacterium]|nr:hypothetical protein [Candidatus Dormibacteraeota bacterium]
MGDWAALEQATIDGFFRLSPSHARVVGDHRFDGVVGDELAELRMPFLDPRFYLDEGLTIPLIRELIG